MSTQATGYVVGVVLILAALTVGRRMCIRVWRDPSRAEMLSAGKAIRFGGHATNRGQTRGMLASWTGLGFIGAGALCEAALSGSLHRGSAAFVLTTALWGVGLLGIVLWLTITWFNWPWWLVPPHMRGDEGTVTAWWRCRHLPPEQRWKARYARRNGPLGHPAPTPARVLAPVPGGWVIALSRAAGGWRNRHAGYLVAVDGERVGVINRGQRLELPVPPGRHTLFLQAGWARSPRLELDATAGQTIGLECAPGNVPAFGAGVDNYIQLWRAGQAQPAGGRA